MQCQVSRGFVSYQQLYICSNWARSQATVLYKNTRNLGWCTHSPSGYIFNSSLCGLTEVASLWNALLLRSIRGVIQFWNIPKLFIVCKTVSTMENACKGSTRKLWAWSVETKHRENRSRRIWIGGRGGGSKKKLNEKNWNYLDLYNENPEPTKMEPRDIMKIINHINNLHKMLVYLVYMASYWKRGFISVTRAH
jgi:hypothetical protein